MQLAAVALAWVSIVAVACGGQPPARPADAPPLTAAIAVVEESAWPAGIEVTASVNPLRRATLGTILMGRVDQVLHREGDRVRAGTVLARIETREVSARLAQAEANVAAAGALEKNARLTKERMERLVAKQAATQKNLEDATAGYEAAAASLHAAEEGVKAAGMYVAYSQVTAPFAGVVVEKHVEAGDTAAPGMPLFVFEDDSKVKVEAHVAESALAGLALGAPVEILLDAARATPRIGTLAEILPAADPRSRTFTVRVILDNPDGALRSGMFARLRLTGTDEQVVAILEGALVRRGPLTGVFVIDAQRVARLRWVTTGDGREGRIRVLTGLAAGERYVAAPPPELEDGRRVEEQ
jgi:RND family efflux transporter MFP subunit